MQASMSTAREVADSEHQNLCFFKLCLHSISFIKHNSRGIFKGYKLRNDSVKNATLVSKSLFMSTQTPEVFYKMKKQSLKIYVYNAKNLQNLNGHQ